MIAANFGLTKLHLVITEDITVPGGKIFSGFYNNGTLSYISVTNADGSVRQVALLVLMQLLLENKKEQYQPTSDVTNPTTSGWDVKCQRYNLRQLCRLLSSKKHLLFSSQ